MLDKIEYHIARNLADRHNYPFAQNIYISIFKSFSHFPIKLKDIGIYNEGNTITFMALVVLKCLGREKNGFLDLYNDILQQLKLNVEQYFPQDIDVETFLGCALYYYHPVNIKNDLSSVDMLEKIFDEKQMYEYEMKKKTILMFTV